MCLHTGNRVLISKSLEKEIFNLNKFIGHVHIKDKNKENTNVVLGTGRCKFFRNFQSIKKNKI